MTRMGAETVRRYYEWQFKAPHEASYIGAWVEDELGGFCICGVFRGAMRGFLAINKWFLAGQVLRRPWVLANFEVRSAVTTAMRQLLQTATGASPPVSRPQGAKTFGILSIAVAPHCRRLGLGGRMMQEAETIARGRGFTTMGLTVRPENTSAIQFYEALGWLPMNAESRGALYKQLQPSRPNPRRGSDRS